MGAERPRAQGPRKADAVSAKLPRTSRIRSRRDFLALQSRGERVNTSHFVLIVRARREPSGARLGIVASRRIGNAVRRNRAKRLVRVAFRALGELFPADIDLVVLVKRVPEGADSVIGEWRAARSSLAKRVDAARRVLAAS